jgi:integrase
MAFIQWHERPKKGAPKGKCRIFIYRGKNKYQSELFRGTEREANRRAATLEHKKTEGTLIEPSRLTVGEYLDQWLGEQSAAPRTLERWSELINQHLKPKFGDTPLVKLDTQTIQTYYLNAQQLDSKGKLSNRTVLHIHRVFRQALKRAVLLRKLAYDPTDLVKPPKPVKPEMKVLDEKELMTLLKGFEGNRLYAPVVVAATTTLRRGELLALRWKDIKADTLSVTRSLEETKAGGLVFKNPKTESSIRPIDLLPLTVETLRRHAVEQKKARLAAGPAWVDEGLVFPTLDGSRWRPSSFTSAFIDRVRAIGFTGMQLKNLRHTHISQLLRAGVNPKLVAARAGHASVKMTMDVYAQFLPADQKRAALTLEAVLQAAALPG